MVALCGSFATFNYRVCASQISMLEGSYHAANNYGGTLMISQRLIPAVAIFAMALGGGAASAAEPSLKDIMQGLRDSLVAMTDGLLLGEVDSVAKAATEISEHAPISELERPIIKKTLGDEMPSFAQFDERVHALSISIGEAAERGELGRAEREYQQMIVACLACHTAYKARVSEALAR